MWTLFQLRFYIAGWKNFYLKKNCQGGQWEALIYIYFAQYLILNNLNINKKLKLFKIFFKVTKKKVEITEVTWYH